MSEYSASALRDKMKDKARRLTEADPHQKVDASSWTPPEAMDADVKTGMRPVSRQPFKKGGAVAGEATKARADRKPRKTGGLVNEWVNRNDKDANEERPGVKHRGGLATGGTAGDYVPTSRMAFQPAQSRLSRAAGLKRGGGAFEGSERDEREDRKLAKEHGMSMDQWERSDLDAKHDRQKSMAGLEVRLGNRRGDHETRAHRKSGGSVSNGELQGMRPKGGREARKDGGGNWIADATKNKGALHRALHVPEGEKIPAKKLAKAEHSENPTMRKRAALAETLKGLHRASGGRAKGKTNINIIIGTPKSGGDPLPPQMPPQAPPMPAMPPRPPVGAGPMPGGPPGLPPGAMPAPPPGMPMARKRGGKVHMDAGAGSGEGRLEKVKEYGANARIKE